MDDLTKIDYIKNEFARIGVPPGQQLTQQQLYSHMDRLNRGEFDRFIADQLVGRIRTQNGSYTVHDLAPVVVEAERKILDKIPTQQMILDKHVAQKMKTNDAIKQAVRENRAGRQRILIFKVLEAVGLRNPDNSTYAILTDTRRTELIPYSQFQKSRFNMYDSDNQKRASRRR